MEGTFIGNEKFGFKKDCKYSILLNEMKRGGYTITTTYNITEDKEESLFCVYSSMNSISNDWELEGFEKEGDGDNEED